MPKPRANCDLDDVIYHWDKTARYMLREVLPDSPFKDDYRLKQPSSYWTAIRDIVGRKYWDWLWKEGVQLGLFRYGHVYAGAIQAVRDLATVCDVAIVTHRPKQAVADTIDWLALMRLPLTGLHILTEGQSKALVPCDYFIDDKPENCVEVYDTGATVFMPRRPWNNVMNHGVVSVSGLPEAVEKIIQDFLL